MSLSVGERIKVLRTLNGLTQEALASLAGLNRASISCWESGAYNPSASKAQVIAKALNCSPAFLFFGDPAIERGAWAITDTERRHDFFAITIGELLPAFLLENGYKNSFADPDLKVLALFKANNDTEPSVISTESDYVWEILNSKCVPAFKCLSEEPNAGFTVASKEIKQLLRLKEYKKALGNFRKIEQQYLEAKQYLDSFADIKGDHSD